MATNYHVLQQAANDETTWLEVEGGPFAGNNDQQAIRAATQGLDADDRSGTFLCIPERSWRPLTRAVEVQEVDRWT
jgi:hypothetical protein